MFVCGDATKNIEIMCQTAPDSICVDENIIMATAKQITDRYNITLGGNIPLTTRMLLGTQQDNMLYVLEEIEQLGTKNLIIAPGCDMPYDTPIENVIGVVQAVRDPITTHAILKNYHAPESNLDVIMPDYAHLERPLVEVYTVDSATCAACGYMFEIAYRAHQELNHNFDLHEYKITQPENIARIKKLGLKNLPAIVINGELKFSSIIPGLRQLIDVIEKTR
jgi:uroporphyrinogen decarboxylase